MTTEVSLLCEAGARSERVNVNVSEPLIGSEVLILFLLIVEESEF
jgi:hypothetical protein